MWDALYASETERALAHRAANPPAPQTPKVSAWAQAGEIVSAPFKGLGQAGMQAARVGNTVAPTVVGNPLAMSAADQEEILDDGGITRQAIDKDLRRGVQALRPDPVTSTVASQFLQEGARVLGKVAGYALAAGPVGAVVGTGIDEGVTGAQELMDRGVDPVTAAKAGAVRGAAVGVSVALPAVGTTGLRTLGLIAAGGPGAFMTEQAITRQILENARYDEIAQEYDPLDPMGLALSAVVPGAVGVALHRARVRRAKDSPPIAELAQDPDMVDAALVSHRAQSVTERALGDITQPEVANSHTKALDDAARALDEGTPVQALDVNVDPVRAAEVIGDMQQRLRPVMEQLDQVDAAPTRADFVTRGEDWGMPWGDITQVLEGAAYHLRDRTPAQAIELLEAGGGRPVPPMMRNAIIGVHELKDRIPELIQQYRALDANRGGMTEPYNLMADAIDRMHRGEAPEAPNRPLARAEMVSRDHPTLLVRMDEGDHAMRVEDAVGAARQEARQDLADSKAFEAAVDCMLRVGS